jgi:hypothetical protein
MQADCSVEVGEIDVSSASRVSQGEKCSKGVMSVGTLSSHLLIAVDCPCCMSPGGVGQGRAALAYHHEQYGSSVD